MHMCVLCKSLAAAMWLDVMMWWCNCQFSLRCPHECMHIHSYNRVFMDYNIGKSDCQQGSYRRRKHLPHEPLAAWYPLLQEHFLAGEPVHSALASSHVPWPEPEQPPSSFPFAGSETQYSSNIPAPARRSTGMAKMVVLWKMKNCFQQLKLK